MVLKACPCVVVDRQILAFKHPFAGLQIPKGSVEIDESIQAAILRELHEESGISAAVLGEKVGEFECVIEAGSYNFTKRQEQRWHLYLVIPAKPLPKRWTHAAFGSEAEDGLLFEYFWQPLTKAPAGFDPVYHRVIEMVSNHPFYVTLAAFDVPLGMSRVVICAERLFWQDWETGNKTILAHIMAKDAACIQWKEPIVLLHQETNEKRRAEYVDIRSLKNSWYKKVGLRKGAQFALLMGIPLALFLLSKLKFTLAASLFALYFRFQKVFLRTRHAEAFLSAPPPLPAVEPAHVYLTKDAILLKLEAGEDKWHYKDILRAKVGQQKIGETMIKQLRIKTKNEGWYTIMVAPEISIKALATHLRTQGVRVRERIENIAASHVVSMGQN